MSRDNQKVQTVSAQSTIASGKLLLNLSYSHFERDRTLVEYALAGMDNGLFVSKYQFDLPQKKTCSGLSRNKSGKRSHEAVIEIRNAQFLNNE